MSSVKFLATLLIAIMLSGCSLGPKRTPLSDVATQSIKELQPYNLVIQDEVRPAINISNFAPGMVAGAGGGALPALIGSMIDSSINKTRVNDAQLAMKTFYFNTEDFDFRQVIAEKINFSLAEVIPLENKIQPPQALLINDEALEDKISKLSSGQALAFTSTFYTFVNNSKALVLETSLFIFLNNKKPKNKKTKPIFYNRFISISPSYGAGGIDSIQLWTDDNSKLYRTTITSLAQGMGDIISYDLKARKNKFCGKRVKAKLRFMGSHNQAKATQFERFDQFVYLQDKTGALYSVPESYVAVDAKAKPVKCK